MFKLLASIKKDLRILSRDRIGLLFMFAMPVILAVLITAVQNSTFDLVNSNKIQLLLHNADKGNCGKLLVEQLNKTGTFHITETAELNEGGSAGEGMLKQDALVGIEIPENFSEGIQQHASAIIKQMLVDLAISNDSAVIADGKQENASVTLWFSPVLQESFRYSMRGIFRGAIQIVENKQLINTLYANFNEKAVPDSLETLMEKGHTILHEITLNKNGKANIPNATQHNIPAWTVFAMFFVVISLGGSIVREKVSGSFLRLKTLPGSFMISLVSKQITYLVVTVVQTVVIFMIGIFLFPVMELPGLTLPPQVPALLLVTFFTGWCAVSFALAVGIYSRTQEQSNGFGAVSVVILAALGGIMVPSFAMPQAFDVFMKVSPLHWCLESFYGLLLKSNSMQEIFVSLVPVILFIIILQVVSYIGLKRKHLIL